MTRFYLRYVLGLARLGHDVWCLEDSGQWPYKPVPDGLVEGCGYKSPTSTIVLRRFARGGKVGIAFPREFAVIGREEGNRREVIKTAGVLVNVSSP